MIRRFLRGHPETVSQSFGDLPEVQHTCPGREHSPYFLGVRLVGPGRHGASAAVLDLSDTPLGSFGVARVVDRDRGEAPEGTANSFGELWWREAIPGTAWQYTGNASRTNDIVAMPATNNTLFAATTDYRLLARDNPLMVHNPDSWWLDEHAHGGREHFDEQHARRYDAKEDAQAAEEVCLLQEAGLLDRTSSVVDIGAGTGQFALAAAAACRRVVAVDISPVMLARLAEKINRRALSNVEVVCAGFLTYQHTGQRADVVYSRYALHHLPDFWKAIALCRIADMLRPGGVLRLWDVVYSFEPRDAERRIDAWITENMTAEVKRGWTRGEMAEHVRDEHSTFTWLLEPMIERAGFDMIDANYSSSGVFARYLWRQR